MDELEEDLQSFATFKTSGVTVTRLTAFVQGLVQRAEQLNADLLLDIELDEQAQARATTLASTAKKTGGSFVRACALLPPETVHVAHASGSSSSEKRRGTHLKRLELPMFKGDIREWTNFWSRFDAAVHSDEERDDGEKLQYFEMALDGEALEFLNGFSKTGEDYALIIRHFQERYSNKDLLAQAYNRDLLAIPAPGLGWRDQRTCLDEIVKILTCLRKLGSHVNEDAIRGIILQKFPEATLAAAYAEAQFLRLINALATGPQSLNLETLEPAIECLRLPLDLQIEALKKALLRLEYFAQAKKDDEQPSASITMGVKTATPKAKSGMKNTGGANAKKTKKMFCALCSKENHRPSACRSFRTVAQRKAQIEALRLCYCCLGCDHQVGDCTAKRQCTICAKGLHHPCICSEAAAAKKKKAATTAPATDSNTTGTFLQTFCCFVSQGSKKCTVRGFLDNGSDTSYIHSSLIQRAGFKVGPSTVLDVLKFAASTPTPLKSQFVSVTVSNFSGTSRDVTLCTTNCIVANSQLAPPFHQVKELLPPTFQYADADLFSSHMHEVEILLGSDLYYDFVYLNGHKRLDNGVVLLRSFFGWIPAGCGNQFSIGNVRKRKFAMTSSAGNPVEGGRYAVKEKSKEDEELDQKLPLMWSLEVLGIRSVELRDKNDAVLASFKETTRFENGRYIVRFPRLKENFHIPTNYRLAVARLKGMLDKMSPQLKLDLHDHFLTQEENGVIERAPRETHHLVHYLPYKAMIRKERMRVVHDASAKTKTGVSLNDMLHTGPSLLKDLVGIMIRFRMNPIALLADIEKAFLQLGLDEADRDLVRFLAPLHPDQPFDPRALVVYRFARVPFGVVSAPFLMNMVLQTHLAAALECASAKEAKWYALARHCFYSDNFVLSVESPSEAVEVYEILTRNLKLAGFNLREWTSNNTEINNMVVDKNLDPPANPMSVLGMTWDRVSDRLSLKFECKEVVKVTKRVALKTYAEVFDPMGLFAPCLLDLKAFIQECWIIGIGWDDPLPAKMEARFRKLKLERDTISQMSVPRLLWVSSTRNSSFCLHIFCDASKRAYGCVHYLVKEDENSPLREAALVFSKLRLAPRKFLPVDQLAEKPTRPLAKKSLKAASETAGGEVERTIPQLELLGAFLAVRTANYVLTQLRERGIFAGNIVLWTDATTVLQWLTTATILPQFTENRLREIRATPNLTVRYVPTKSNPADYLTRGKVASDLGDLWFKGPQWLVQERLWPVSPPNAPQFTTSPVPGVVSALSKTVPRLILLTDSLEQKFSHWGTYVRWFSILRKNVFGQRVWQLSATAEYARAENALLRALQQKYFPSELAQLESKVQPRAALDLFLDKDGLIRCYGRLQHADLPYDAIHPIFLPRASRLTDLLFFSIHNKNGHVGAAHLLATFRERFWVLKGRAQANSIVHRCTICRRAQGGPYQLPPMPPLPTVRVENAEPFLNVGVDCFGPFYVRLPHPTPDVTYTKMYGVIFACMVTRALHLEVLGDMSGDQFLLALMRFTSRRGVPDFMYSDNGTNFVFVQPLVGPKVQINHETLNEYLLANKITWAFIPALSPWYGGVYERLIGLVKKCLSKMLGPYIASYSSLSTAFCVVENNLNNRPLTYVSSTDTVEALTPNHFLRLRKRNPATELELVKDPADTASTADDMVKAYLAARHLIETFRVTFHQLYLSALRTSQVRLHRAQQGSVQCTPKPDAVVLVQEPSAPRARWPIGVIEKLDRRHAQATVRIVVADQKTRLLTPLKRTFPTHLITRPVCRLYPFETSLSFDTALVPPVPPQSPSSSPGPSAP